MTLFWAVLSHFDLIDKFISTESVCCVIVHAVHTVVELLKKGYVAVVSDQVPLIQSRQNFDTIMATKTQVSLPLRRIINNSSTRVRVYVHVYQYFFTLAHGHLNALCFLGLQFIAGIDVRVHPTNPRNCPSVCVLVGNSYDHRFGTQVSNCVFKNDKCLLVYWLFC